MRPGSDWCTLCFADLRPVPPPRPAPVVPAPAPTPGSAAPAGTAVAAPGVGVVPCTVCGTDMLLSSTTCPACGSGLFDGLRTSSTATLTLPLLGDLMRFPQGLRIAIALTVSVLAVALVIVPIGLIF